MACARENGDGEGISGGLINIKVKKSLVSAGDLKVEVYTKGDDPKLLITSGVHGDELEVIDSVRKAVEKYHDHLEAFVYIPVVSPTAVTNRTRENGHKLDPNRLFKEGSAGGETEKVMDFLREYRFDLHVDFHEDVVLHDFYVYEAPPRGEKTMIKLFSEIKGIGVDLWEGVDDPDDPALGHLVVNGYTSFSVDHTDNSLDAWLRFSGRSKRSLVPEVPGLVAKETKDKIVDAIFRHLIIKTES